MKTVNGKIMKGATSKRLSTTLALALTMSFAAHHADAATTAVNLGTAANFVALAGSGMTFAGPVNSTVLTGDIGSFPTATITGTENLVLNGVNHAGDGVTQQAKTDLLAAYNNAAIRSADVTFPLIHNVGGLTLVSGVYKAPSSLGISTVLTLDGNNDPNAVWIFQIGSTLITSSGSSVNLINGAQASNVFWQVGSSATLGTNSEFEGTILALQSITLETGATSTGRVLAINAAVTFDNNVVAIPEPGTGALIILGLSLATFSRRRGKVCAL